MASLHRRTSFRTKNTRQVSKTCRVLYHIRTNALVLDATHGATEGTGVIVARIRATAAEGASTCASTNRSTNPLVGGVQAADV